MVFYYLLSPFFIDIFLHSHAISIAQINWFSKDYAVSTTFNKFPGANFVAGSNQYFSLSTWHEIPSLLGVLTVGCPQ